MRTLSQSTAGARSVFGEEPEHLTPIRLSAIISALSYALDLTEGQPLGHSVRSCILGMRIAQALKLPLETQTNLYYALLLKDAGCSSNASRLYQILDSDEIKAKCNVKTTDWTRFGWESLHYALDHVKIHRPFFERAWGLLSVAVHNRNRSRELVQIRCERGATIAKLIGFSEATAAGIHALDEQWNGNGFPYGLRGTGIPLIARILSISQTLEVFYSKRGPNAAIEAVKDRSGRWFDPELVRIATCLSHKGHFWAGLDSEEAAKIVVRLEPATRSVIADDPAIENICHAFADVIDAKSPFTYRHSIGVAAAAVDIAAKMNLPEREISLIRRAALLHDIGKLGVPNSILEKPGKLTAEEWASVRRHPFYSQQILRMIPGFWELSEIAGAHHERLDGTGYFQNLTAPQLSLPARILTVADIYDALSARRPYRDALAAEEVFGIMKKDTPHALDASCFQALIESR